MHEPADDISLKHVLLPCDWPIKTNNYMIVIDVCCGQTRELRPGSVLKITSTATLVVVLLA